MKKNRILIIISSIITIYAIIGFIALPKILKPQIVNIINENINQTATLHKIDFNPFLLKFTIHELKIFNEKETTFSVEKLLIDFSIFKSIDEQHISFKALEIVNPYINIIEYEDGTFNLEKLLTKKKEEQKEEKENKSNIKFQIYKTILERANIKFTKYSKDSEPFVLNINKLNYTFYDMGTYQNTLASHNLQIIINNNTELIIKGGVRLDPFEMYGNVELRNFKPQDFLSYKKSDFNFVIEDSTFLDLQFGFKVDARKDLKVELNDTHLNLRNINIKQKDDSILSIKHLSIENLNLKYPQNKITIDSIFIDKLKTKVIIDKNEKLNFASLVKNETTSDKKSDTIVQDETTKEIIKEEKKTEKIVETKDVIQKDSNNATNNWSVKLNKFNIKESELSFNDIKNALFIDTNNINIDLSNFTLNGKNFTLNKLSLYKPTITIKDNKNKITVINKELSIELDNLISKDQIINLEKINIKNNGLTFKDLKNRLNIDTSKINIDINKLIQSDNNTTLENISLSTPSLSFKDLKQRLNVYSNNINIKLNDIVQNDTELNLKNILLSTSKVTIKDAKNRQNIFTKKTTVKVSNIKKVKDVITIASINLTNPSIFVKNNKDNLKILTNKLSINSNKIKLNNGNISISKIKIKTPSIKFDDIKSKLNVKTKNLNIIVTNTSFKKQNLKVGILSITKPSIYLVDNKNDLTIVAKKLSLKINNINNYKNSLKIAKINLYEPDFIFKDNKSKTDLSAKNMYLTVKKISYKNNKLKIVSSSLNKPNISIILGKKEKIEEPINTKIEEKDKPKKKVVVTKKKKSSFKFDIGPFKIKNAKMSFQDKNLPIPFKTDITKLNGEFSRLNSDSSKPTKLSLEGTVDEYGYTKITGIVDINDVKLLTDTNIIFKNIAIKNFTPYSGKFIGREIESGKLNLSLKYNIKESDLNAQNSIVISDIKLGKTIESADAVSLPLELAIALLEDTNGVIDLNLPISGNVDDPEFSVAPIVWKVFTNLIVKAITAPFRLLASAFGFSEEDIKSLEFEFGKDTIIASEKESLDNIATILSKKSKLAIKIKPSYHETKDLIALQDYKFEKYLEKKMKKVLKGDDYKEALEELFEKLDKSKKLDDVKKSFTKINKNKKETFDNTSYVEHLRKTLASKQKVTQVELIALANKRTQNISKYLIEVKKVKKEAIVIEKDITKLNNNDAKWLVFDLDVAVKK